MDLKRHTGKSVVVTGAGRGIGRSVALQFAAEGARVIGFDINEEGLEESANLLSEAGQSLVCFAGDIAAQPDVDRFIAETLDGQPVDILANVAGIGDHLIPIGEMDDATWDSVMAVNTSGPMRLIRALLPGMLENGGGAIVNVASVAAFSGGGAGAAYTASKHALLGLTRSIAFYYGSRGIRCNAVAPGPVQTDLSGTSTPTVEWAWQLVEPLLIRSQRYAVAEDIAEVVSWLGSGESSIINGTLIAADAGWSAT